MLTTSYQMFGNIPRSIEHAVDWVTDAFRWMRDNEVAYLKATEKGMDDWTAHVHESGKGLLANGVNSWLTGVNKNLAHKQKRSMTRYAGPAPGYRRRCDEVRERGYVDFDVKRS